MKARNFTLAAMSLVLGAGALIGLSPDLALANGVHCGDTVTTDTTLQSDLTGCPGTALVIGADHITLNLHGHTVSSTPDSAADGIANDGHRDVTVREGTVRGFGIGIALRDATENHLTALKLSDAGEAGIILANSDRNSIRRNVASHSTADADGSGIVLVQSTHNDVSNNLLFHDGDGIMLVQSGENRVVRNSISRSGAGVVLVDGSARNLIAANLTLGNSDTGVLLDQHADDNVISRNFASGNAFAGIAVGASDGNVVRRNIADGNPGSGIAVGDNADGTVVIGNQANGNGATPPGCVPDCPLLDDGIDVDRAPGTTLTRNTADRNHDLGIEAVAGTTDGGANHAFGNGNPAQCTNVICAP